MVILLLLYQNYTTRQVTVVHIYYPNHQECRDRRIVTVIKNNEKIPRIQIHE